MSCARSLAAAKLAAVRARIADLERMSSALRQRIHGLGTAGPVAVIGLMTLAILVSPIPSAPIALAAGELGRILFAVLVLGLLTGVPLAVHFLRKRDASTLDR